MTANLFKTRQAWMLVAMLGILALLAGTIDPAQAAWIRSASPWATIVVGSQSTPEHLATLDLQRYLAQVTGRVPLIIDAATWQKHPKSAAVVLGTPATNPLLKGLALDPRAVGEQGYLLVEQTAGKARLIVAAGLTTEGATNAVYGLLKELGFGFYLGSEAIPAKLPPSIGTQPIVRQPASAIRGVLPWYNFFDSPTAWDPIDHRTFIDQLVRSGANFVGFHSYDNEPFAAYEEAGKMVWGGRLYSTSTSTWGTHPMATSEYGYGTDKFFAQPYFGADSTTLKDDNAAVRIEQDVMRDALDYARKRGLKTCLGFEINGDPLDPKEREVFLKRLNHVMDQYPALDYIWIWQPEAQGIEGFRTRYARIPFPFRLDPKSPLALYGIARREMFKRVVENPTDATPRLKERAADQAARAVEGARLEQFGQLAYHALAHRAGAPKLVISGWGGEDRALSEEYYEALDKLLPRDVVFSSLEYISPREHIDKIYSELPKDRQRWPIPWMENDGDQWHPQPFVHIYEGMVKNVQKSGSQGILGIHWRTREIEENFAYLMDSAWQPGLTADQFYADTARRCYPPEIAQPMGAILNKLDELGYRWVGGSGQSECGNFTWAIGDEPRRKTTLALRDQAAALLPKAGASRERLQILINSLDWVLLYEQAQIAALKAQELLTQATRENPERAQSLAREAMAVMDKNHLGQALQAFAQRIPTRGEYGVLATINTKAVWEWRNIRSQASKILGASVEEKTPAWKVNTPIQLPRLIGSTAAGEPLELMPIVIEAKPAWVHYRTLGQKKWSTLPLQTVKGWVRRAVIPASAVKEPGLEIGFSLNASPLKPMNLSPKVVTVMPKLEVGKTPPVVAACKKQLQIIPVVNQGKTSPIELTWNDTLEADYYKVLRDGQVIVETAAAYAPDFPTQATGQYVVEAWRDGRVLAKSEPVCYTSADLPLDEKINLETKANLGGVLFKWPATQSSAVSFYKVQVRSKSRKKGASSLLARIAASRSSEHSFHHIPAKGTWIYSITPMNATGREGAPATVEVRFPPKPVTTPAIDLPLTQKPEGAKITGNVSFDQDGARFFGGSMELPHQPGMNLGNGMTLTFDFKSDETPKNEPIMLCHGLWHGDGWYMQMIGGDITAVTLTMDVHGPKVESDKWYHVRYVFDGEKLHLAVNGQWLRQPDKTNVQPFDTDRPLIFGQYVSPDPDRYKFLGRIRNVKIYPDVLLDLSEKLK